MAEPARPHEFKLVGTKSIKLSKLVFDNDLYPRCEINKFNVAQLLEKLKAGIDLDPIAVEEKSLRIIDGVHRWKAYRKRHSDDPGIKVVVYRYQSEVSMLRHAALLNLHHGVQLNKQDQVNVIWKLRNGGMVDNDIRDTLGVTKATFEVLSARIAYGGKTTAPPSDADTRKQKESGTVRAPTGKVVRDDRELVPLKGSTAHLSGETLNSDQVRANDQVMGYPQIRMVNDLIRMIDADILDKKNARLMDRLRHLGELISGLFSGK